MMLKTDEPTNQRPRARQIVVAEGVYVHVGDLRTALKDDALVLESASMLLVARKKGDHAIKGLRHAIGYFVATMGRQMKRPEIPDPITVKGGCPPYTKANVVALATVLEFGQAAKEEGLGQQEIVSASIEAIKMLEQIVVETQPPE